MSFPVNGDQGAHCCPHECNTMMPVVWHLLMKTAVTWPSSLPYWDRSPDLLPALDTSHQLGKQDFAGFLNIVCVFACMCVCTLYVYLRTCVCRHVQYVCMGVYVYTFGSMCSVWVVSSSQLLIWGQIRDARGRKQAQFRSMSGCW